MKNIAIVFIAMFIAPCAAMAQFSGGDGSYEEPYKIETAAQLDEIRNRLSSHFKLENDIDLTAYLASGGAGHAKWGDEGWMPIGYQEAPFTGTLDGDGYKITGLWINRAIGVSALNNNIGLFGFVQTAAAVSNPGPFFNPNIFTSTFRNLGVVISEAGISGRHYVGGLAGNIEGAHVSDNFIVSNCYTTGGKVQGIDWGVGGLIGRLEYNSVKIRNCYSTCDVTSNTTSARVGGLIGELLGGTIENCYATGNVELTLLALGSSKYAGGLIGFATANNDPVRSVSVNNCYATGIVKGMGNIGGLIGYVNRPAATTLSVNNCAALNPAVIRLDENNNDYTGRVIGNFLNFSGSSNTLTNNVALNRMTVIRNGSVLNVTSDAATKQGLTITISSILADGTIGDRFTTANGWAVDNGKLPGIGAAIDMPEHLDIFAGGYGTSENPYIIETAAQLDEVRNGMTEHYKLGKDINLTDYLAEGGAGHDKWGDEGWLPIGSTGPGSSAPTIFTGSLDGAEFKITGLWINRPSDDYVGLFCRVFDSGFLGNLGVEIAEAGVTGRSSVGGLAGSIGGNRGASNCYTSGGMVQGSDNVGGLVGNLSISHIIHSYSTSREVIATANLGFAGGLVGNMEPGSSIKHSYAASKVDSRGSSGRAGGLLGGYTCTYNATGEVSNCYTTGEVTSRYATGGLIGEITLLNDNHQIAFTFILKNCVALNPSVINSGLEQYVGRVLGKIDLLGSYPPTLTLSGNAANSRMTVGVGQMLVFTPAADNKHGVNITANDLRADGTIGARFTNTGDGEWVTENGMLPGIGAAVDLPEHLRLHFTEGNGAPENPYIIETATQLSAMRYTLEAHYKLNNDIDLTDYLAEEGAGYAKWGDEGWLPVGDRYQYFTGSLDGDGYSITGLTINRPSINYVGLFGLANAATFKRISIESAITGLSNTSTLAGYAGNGSIIEYCHAAGSVNGLSYTGGLVGQISGNIAHSSSSADVALITGGSGNATYFGGLAGSLAGDGQIINSNATGNISGSRYSGGLVGQINNGKIENSYATGNVTSSGGGAGGLLGLIINTAGNESGVERCFASGDVTANSSAGGLIGELNAGFISNSYAIGNVSGGNDTGGLVGRQFGNIENCYAVGKVTSTGTPLGGLVANRFGGTISNSFFDRETTGQTSGVGSGATTGITSGTTVLMKNKNYFESAGWDFADIWCMPKSSYPELRWNMFDSGTGDENSPYEISADDQLAWLTEEINKGNKIFKDKRFILVNDIDLSEYGATFNGGKGWIPIGKTGFPFGGAFDGNNKTITGLYINDASLDKAGLFGEMENATIEKLGIINVDITARENVGAITGIIKSSSIKNCYTMGAVNGNRQVGGILGSIDKGSVENCYTTCTVSGGSGSNLIGGIVGTILSDSSVENCAAFNPDVNAANPSVGRITGNNSGSMSDNVSFVGMNLSPRTATNNANGIDGADITIAAIHSDGTIGDRFTEPDGWTIENGKLPGFGSAVNMPDHLTSLEFVVTFSVVNPIGGTLTAKAVETVITSGDEVERGKNIIFTATPSDGYRVKEWKLNSVIVSNIITPTYTHEDLKEAITVTVEFEGIPPVISITDLPNGTVDVTYHETLIATGIKPIEWTLSENSKLPDGLSLSGAGIISGTPKKAGLFPFTVKATNSTGYDDQILTITIAQGAGATLIGNPTMESKSHNSITVNAVTKPANGQEVEYAISTINFVQPSFEWRSSTTFNGLTPNTPYYVFARAAQNDNYLTGTAVISSAIFTDYPTSSGEIQPVNLLKAWIRNGMLHVTGLTAGETLNVYNASGALIYQNVAISVEADIPLNVQGVYMVLQGKQMVRVVFQ